MLGAEARLFRAALGDLLWHLAEAERFEDDWPVGIRTFDALSFGQRLSILEIVGRGLLIESEPAPDLTAVAEAALAAVYEHLRGLVAVEVDSAVEVKEDAEKWRHLIHDAALETVDPEDREDLPECDCDDRKEWDGWIELLQFHFLWDTDWDFDMVGQDASPEHSARFREMFGIAEDYYTAVAPDPEPDQIPALLLRLSQLTGEELQLRPEAVVSKPRASRLRRSPVMWSRSDVMFDVEIDFAHRFKTLMSDRGDGILLTRQLQLPFTPYEGLRLVGKDIDTDFHGQPVEAVAWDMDRKVFLIDTSTGIEGVPLEGIPAYLRFNIEVGWRLGSYAEHYAAESADETSAAPIGLTVSPKTTPEQWEEMGLSTADPKKRPEEFNLFLKALVRMMAETHNNWPTAFAIDQTGRFFEKKPDDAKLRKPWAEWNDARRRFEAMNFDEQYAWTKGLVDYPDLNVFLTELFEKTK